MRMNLLLTYIIDDIFGNIKDYLLILNVYSQMKAHFDTLKSVSGAPQFESLDVLASGMTRKSAALLFYQTCGITAHNPLTYQLY